MTMRTNHFDRLRQAVEEADKSLQRLQITLGDAERAAETTARNTAGIVRAATALLEQADAGPVDCSGTMGNGERVWKGSFLEKLENLRTMANKP